MINELKFDYQEEKHGSLRGQSSIVLSFDIDLFLGGLGLFLLDLNLSGSLLHLVQVINEDCVL